MQRLPFLFWLPMITWLAGPRSFAKEEIIINEIFYNAPGKEDLLQFIELYNRGQSEADISRWRLRKGIRFVFPETTRLAAGSYLVVCRNRAEFVKRYGAEVPAIGDFEGKLSHGGERVELADAHGAVIDVLSYSDAHPWPTGPDGYSASLERICPQEPTQRPDNWASSGWSPDHAAAGTPGKRNGCYHPNLPPSISEVHATVRESERSAQIDAHVTDPDGIAAVTLSFRIVSGGKESEETSVPMALIAGNNTRGLYRGVIPAQPEGTLVRFRIKALDKGNEERLDPPENEPRPSHSYYLSPALSAAQIAQCFVLQVRPAVVGQEPPKAEKRQATRPNEYTSGALIYAPPQGGPLQIFDHVRMAKGREAFKIKFQKDRPLKGMSVAKINSRGKPRWLLSEPLSYELYRMSGVPAPLTEPIRLWMDGRPSGYRLLVEQPNRSFLSRNRRDATGNLYKVVWFGRDLVRKHQKKTNRSGGHQDLLDLVRELGDKTGTDQWEFIQRSFATEEVATYYAVSMCISDWDGFHNNNYFAYHDSGRTEMWEIYPWDKDKTWGDYDYASKLYDWYEMPLTLGMQGDQPPPLDPQSKANNRAGYLGNVSWWREGGYFSRPLLANPGFRALFLARLDEVCATYFTEDNLLPRIDSMERALEPEVRLWAEASGKSTDEALQIFKSDLQSLREQVKDRREFILAALKKLE